MKHAIMIDFGSTFTKVAVASIEDQSIVFTTKHPSTVKTDALIGLNCCLDEVRAYLGNKEFDEATKLASSSAAGGLRMAVVGLSKNLSIEAGRNAAFGAGAKILKTFAGTLRNIEISELEELDIEILLFCGGYDGGNTSTILHNGKKIAESRINVPVIYGGNSFIAKEVRDIFLRRGKKCFVVKNIIPGVGKLETGGAEELIREIFMKGLINMKGLDRVKGEIGDILMPTPAAVLKAGELFSKGYEGQEGKGPLMIVDVGGSTTDIHSFVDTVVFPGAKLIGAAEPYSKRTVEGDLGMRESAGMLGTEVGYDLIAKKVGMSEEEVEESILARMKDIKFIPVTSKETELDMEIAALATHIAVWRHAGAYEGTEDSIHKLVQIGKNLTPIKRIIGTGGAIINSQDPKYILDRALNKMVTNMLLPQGGELFLDRDYVLYAAGLLSEIDKKTAFAILNNSIVKL